MPYATKCLSALLLVVTILGGTPPATAPAATADALPPLRWAADAEGGAPYIFKDPADPNRNIGFEVDLARLLSQELGRPIDFVQYDYVSLVPGLLRGDFDLAMNGLEVTPDRRAKVRFSRPYYQYSLQLVARADERRFDDLEGCQRAGLTVGTLGDTAAQRLLDRLGVATRIYEDQMSPFRDLGFGRIDAVLLDLPITIYFADPDPRSPRHDPKLKFVGRPRERGYYAIALRPDAAALAAEVDAALSRLLTSGRLREVYEKWRIWNDDQLALATAADAGEVQRTGQAYDFARSFAKLGQGALLTVGLTFSSMALAVALGLPLALARLYGPRPLQWAAMLYVEFFRGIPVLLLLFFLYYGLPAVSSYYRLPVPLTLTAVQAAILGFGMNYAAYEAEIYRAGIHAIPVGQWEAAASLGMSRWLTFRRIILPQAIRVILPPSTSDLVALFKDTSVVSILALEDLTKQYHMLAKQSGQYLELGLLTALLYLVMSVPLGLLSRHLEQRWGKGL